MKNVSSALRFSVKERLKRACLSAKFDLYRFQSSGPSVGPGAQSLKYSGTYEHSRPTPHGSAQIVSVIKVSKIQVDQVSGGWRHGKFFLNANITDKTRKTESASAESGWVIWDDEFHFDALKGSSLTFTLYATHLVRHDTMIGLSVATIDSNLWRTGNSVEMRLQNESGTPLRTHLHFKVELLPPDTECAAIRQEAANARHSTVSHETRHIDQGIQAAIPLGMAFGPVRTAAAPQGRDSWHNDSDGFDVVQLYSVTESWNVLLNNVQTFTANVAVFSEILPYAKCALAVLIMAEQAVIAQKERDDRFQQLIKLNSDAFAFLNKLRTAALKGHRKTMKHLVIQTTECGYFIRDYTKHKSFIVRAARNVVYGATIDAKIGQFENKFREITAAFRNDAALTTEIAVFRIVDHVEQFTTTVELNDLRYASGARFDRGKQCLSGTRVGLLDKISEWVNDVSKPRVLVLSGPAGAGKSAIAHTVACTFDEQKRLGSSFFFDIRVMDRRPDMLFSTIARDLADLDPEWKAALYSVIGSRAQRRTGSIVEQFEEFILKPARSFEVYFGPVVVVIDGLDSSVDRNQCRELVSLLSTRATALPRNFRVLVTTRPQSDICRAFREGNNVAMWDMDAVVDKDSNLDDLAAYFSNELSSAAGLEWTDKFGRKLAAKSNGNFAWAATACAFIKDPVAGQTPDDRLSRVLSTPKDMPFNEKEDPHLVSVRGSIRRKISKLDQFFNPRPPSDHFEGIIEPFPFPHTDLHGDDSIRTPPQSRSNSPRPEGSLIPSFPVPAPVPSGRGRNEPHRPHLRPSSPRPASVDPPFPIPFTGPRVPHSDGGIRPNPHRRLNSPRPEDSIAPQFPVPAGDPPASYGEGNLFHKLHLPHFGPISHRPPSREGHHPTRPSHLSGPPSKFANGVGEDDIPVLPFQAGSWGFNPPSNVHRLYSYNGSISDDGSSVSC
ncbi:hypothetical protein GGX14DRAFT_607523 [Mycena pura]|uniref:NACHT domain-containing protein n=1 Tax=Mycena pura TaxID=153505 RepID=A0AAD6UL32_9AGAR|nr:hypothetical protein GGX14DRAFT_607523 [Mycena pura]